MLILFCFFYFFFMLFCIGKYLGKYLILNKGFIKQLEMGKRYTADDVLFNPLKTLMQRLFLIVWITLVGIIGMLVTGLWILIKWIF